MAREDILEEIFKALHLRDVELKNKVLILDGFDEISISGNREKILNKLNQEVGKMKCLGKFSLIITCRENYVNQSGLSLKTYITLQAWNEDQIISFCNIYKKMSSGNLETKFPEVKSNAILKNKEMFGIPLILYMILALDIDVEKNSSIVDVYDQIFSLERGEIYNRCYDKEHRTNKTEIKKCIYQISQKIAFWMFENNADKATISQEEFKKICEDEIQGDILIGNFFKLKYCGGSETNEIYFIHRSIYEYFVVIYFFESINNLTSKEEVAGKLGELLKCGKLSEQILEFIKYKFDSMSGYNLPDLTREVFNIMLKMGMSYYMKKQRESLLDSIRQEGNIFFNMLNIVCLWNSELGECDNGILIYLRCNIERKLNLKGIKLGIENLSENSLNRNLRGICLKNANLEGAYLSGADLSGADLGRAGLSGADLSGAYLEGVYLSRADLRGADLEGAYLGRADLIKADLGGAYLIGAYLSGTYLSGADLRGASLIGADLRGAYLIGADLERVDLSGAYLIGADLEGEYLSEVYLERADLSEVYLSGADLNGTIFNESQVNLLCEKYDLSDSRVYLSETETIISYKEYCIRKQKKVK